MKILKLIIRNLASIENAVIDFENGPLAEESCFLICGPTGSGKTTLLDAICLALYGKTPRMNEANRERYVDHTENFGDDISIDDVRGLMKRGTDCASVELWFTDANDHPLKSIWQVERSRNRGGYIKNGKIQSPKWTLSEIDDTVICSKKSETEQTIRTRLGLTFEQFCRTTLLAQGDFTKFLRSNEGEKSAILEKLTGTEIYSEISREIHRTKTEKEKELALLEERTKGIILLSDEEIKRIEEEKEKLKNFLEEQSCKEKNTQDNLKILIDYQKERSIYKKANEELEEDRAFSVTETFLAEQRLLKEWEDTTDVRMWWLEKKRLMEEKNSYQQEEKELHQRYNYLWGGWLYFLDYKAQKEKRQNERLNLKDAEKHNIKIYEQISFITGIINQIKQTKDTIKGYQSNINKLKVSLQTQQEKEIEFKRIHSRAIKKEEEIEQRFNQIKAEASKYNLKQLTEAFNFTNTCIDTIKCTLEWDEISTKIKQQEKELELLKTTEDNLKTALHQKNKEIEELQSLYELQKRKCDDLEILREMRPHYHEGDTCPFCGEKIRTFTNEENFKSILTPIEDTLSSKRNEEKEILTKLYENQSQQSIYLKDLNERKGLLPSLEARKNELQRTLKMHPLFTEASLLKNNLVTVQAKKEQLSNQIKEASEKQKQVEEYIQIKNQASETVRNIEKELNTINGNLQQTKGKINTQEASISTLETNILSYQQQLATLIDLEKWKSQGDIYIKSLQDAAQLYQENISKISEGEKILLQIEEAENQMQELQKNIKHHYPNWETESCSMHEIKKLTNEWTTLSMQVTSLHGKTTALDERINFIDNKMDSFYKGNSISVDRIIFLSSYTSEEIKNIRQKHQQFHEHETTLLTTIKKSQEAIIPLEKKLETIGYHSSEDFSLIEKETLKLLEELKIELSNGHQLMGQYVQQLKEDQHQKEIQKRLLNQINEAYKIYTQWETLHQLFGSNDGKKFRNIAQSYVLRHLLINTNHYLHQLTDRYELECNPGSLTILVQDKEAGGITRPITTISGGESFLISLSLALGLSSLSKKTLAMDILFIDEGFGTLDNSYLSTVMDTLERLHQIGGKRIGIISHVESLKERIPTQIQVIKENNTSSRIKVLSSY